jgi:hypothetical protein
MSIDGRLDRLTPALTAKERAILILRASKEGTPEDPELRTRMPAEQAREFNHYIGLMNGVNIFLTFYAGVLNQALAYLDARYGWLLTLHLWALDVADLARYITLYTKEPITRSGYEQRLAEAREEMVPASELAELLAEDYEGWKEEDLEPQKGEDEPQVTDAAWERVCREKELELAGLADQGVLVGGRKGRRLAVQAGSFYDWRASPVPLFPDWGWEFEVLPDRQADEVRRLREARRRTQKECRQAPLSLVLDLPRPRRKTRRTPEASRTGEEIAEAVGARLRERIQLRWRELRSIEAVLEELAGEFDGEEPTRPWEREALDEGKERLDELHRAVQKYASGRSGCRGPTRRSWSRSGSAYGGRASPGDDHG